MRVVIAPDKFKGSLTAPEAAAAMARGVRRVAPRALIDEFPWPMVAKGRSPRWLPRRWDRTARSRSPVLWEARSPHRSACSATAARRCWRWPRPPDLTLVPPDRRDPWRTTTRGTGELLLAAIGAGARRVILGIGGSATNDGGAGLGQALGFRLLDSEGRELGPGGGELGRLARIDGSARGRLSRLRGDRRGLRRDEPTLRTKGSLGRLRTAERGGRRDGRSARPPSSPTSRTSWSGTCTSRFATSPARVRRVAWAAAWSPSPAGGCRGESISSSRQ